MKRFAIAFVVAVPAAANAQVGYPVNLPPPPVSLDPASAPSSPAPAAPTPAPAQPSVIVVGPDGKVMAGAPDAGDSGAVYMTSDHAQPTLDQPIVGAAVPELHVVRRGDTLWDICFLYFNDPWQWPKIWSYNPQITNPHWIYPGDLVRLLPRGMFSSITAPTNSDAPTAFDPLPAPMRKSNVGIKQTAFVEKSDLDRSSSISGAQDEKLLLGDGDVVYLSYPENKPPKVGARLSIYTPDHAVKANGNEVGAYVRVLGTAEVTSVKQDKRARAVILDANQEIERGAKVGPLMTSFKNVPPVPAKVDAQGQVVAMLTYDQLIGDGEVVFVDLGKKSGVEVGNRMYVVRRGDGYPKKMSQQIAQDDRQFPARALGEIVIVDVGERVSVGLITLSTQEMAIGDLVMMQASK